jgi:ligand-binding sensor domain-containing protein
MMWVGTGAGLCQYDGKKFMVLGVKDGLVGENIFSITEDDEQNIWVGCMKGGISKFNGKTFTNYTKKDGLVSDNVRVVWYSKKFHRLFIGTNDGCSVFDGKKFISLNTNDSKTKDLFVMGFLEGDDCVNVYAYDYRPYYKFFPKTNRFVCIKNSYYQMHNTSTSPMIMLNGDTIIGSLRDGINVLHAGLKHSFKGMGQVFDMKEDPDKNVWVACWSENSLSKEMPGGLYKYDGQNVIRCSEKLGISDPTVWCLYYDTSFRILWVGTLNSGMYKIPVPAFEWYDPKDFKLNDLNVLSLLSSTNNDLWIGTKGFLLKRSQNGGIRFLDDILMKRILGSYPLDYRCIRQDRRGDVYVSTYITSLVKYSQNDNFDKSFLVNVKPGATQFAFDTHDSVFYSDRWWDGIFHCSLFPSVSKPIRWLFRENSAPTNITKMISSGDTIWYISQTEGLFRTCRGKIDYFRKDNPSIPHIINDICFDQHGNIIIGSNTGEVIITSYRENSLKIIHRLHSGTTIIGNTIKFLVVDKTNHLFIGTDLGLNRINLTKLYSDGKVISNFYCSEVGYYDHSGKVAECDKDGNIWIGTDNHLLKIDTKLLEQLSSGLQKVRISSLDVNYQNDTTFHFDHPQRFSYGKNNLIFHFSVNNILNPEQTRYRYKLEGLSERWSEFSHEDKAIFTSLPSGKYRLVVESGNPLDNTKGSSMAYEFRINPPWYQNFWIIIGFFLLLILTVIVIIRYRTKQIQRIEQKKTEYSKQLATIEMRALQSQMNPHFIFNSINSIQGFILQNKIDEARTYLMDFSKIIRQTLDNATKEYISLQEELEYLRYYLNLELMRFDKKFQVDIRVPADVNPQNILIPPMLVQPYVENSIRHGLLHKRVGQGHLTVEFIIEGENYLKCIIEDNGVGREKSKEIESWKNLTHKPQSTRITQDRIGLLNLSSRSEKYKVNIIDLVNAKGTPRGTRVELLLPLRTF